MADKKSATEKAAPDPTVFSGRGRGPEYPEGSHPPVDPSDASWGPGRFSYSDLDDDLKPAKDSVVQTLDEDPLQSEAQETLRKDSEAQAKQSAESSEK